MKGCVDVNLILGKTLNPEPQAPQLKLNKKKHKQTEALHTQPQLRDSGISPGSALAPSLVTVPCTGVWGLGFKGFGFKGLMV